MELVQGEGGREGSAPSFIQFQVPGCREEGKKSILDGWEMETVRRKCEAAKVRLGV